MTSSSLRTDDPAHGGDLDWASRRYGIDPGSFIDFSANVNPLGPPAAALEAARNALGEIIRYPEPDSASLKGALSAFLGVRPESVMLGNGSTELIHHVCRCEKRERVTVVAPAFAEYERAARISGARVSFYQLVPENSFSIDNRTLASAAAGSDIIFVCNPASPSGHLYKREELLPALEACREKGALMVVDESFMGFCAPGEAGRASLLFEARNGGLVIVSTMTKLFALAGLRGPGWLVSNEEEIARLQQAAFPWRINSPAQVAATAALGDRAYLAKTRDSVARWREELQRDLEATGHFEAYPSRTNFLLLRILDDRLNSASLRDGLGRRGILIRDCANFRGLDSCFVRVSVQKPANNERLIAAIREVWE